MHQGPFSGVVYFPPEVVLLMDSELRFRIGPCGYGIPGDLAALVDVGPSYCWALPKDDHQYFLKGVLEVPKPAPQKGQPQELWSGRVELPPVLIPTKPLEPEAAKLGALIEELGAKVASGDSRKAIDALQELSLIDDARIVPCCLTAVMSDRYELRCRGIDLLSRLEGDAALDGLKIGALTWGQDLANCSSAELAEKLAENVRHAAALGLARSPHPQAKALLLSMHDDTARAVRITVIQTAAKMRTNEARKVLNSSASDNDPDIRREAKRLLELVEQD